VRGFEPHLHGTLAHASTCTSTRAFPVDAIPQRHQHKINLSNPYPDNRRIHRRTVSNPRPSLAARGQLRDPPNALALLMGEQATRFYVGNL